MNNEERPSETTAMESEAPATDVSKLDKELDHLSLCQQIEFCFQRLRNKTIEESLDLAQKKCVHVRMYTEDDTLLKCARDRGYPMPDVTLKVNKSNLKASEPSKPEDTPKETPGTAPEVQE